MGVIRCARLGGVVWVVVVVGLVSVLMVGMCLRDVGDIVAGAAFDDLADLVG